MATVGAKLTIPFIVGAGQIVGQGEDPELWCLYSTDDASSTSPTWTDATAKVRAFNIARGRETELDEVDAGTANITLDNRARTFDPAFNSAIRPLNRWWIREQFTGETQDLFVGYAEAYEQTWGPGVSDAQCVVSLADEFKVLALDGLPTMSPPRDSYADLVVGFDGATGYWPMNDDYAATNVETGNPGPVLIKVLGGSATATGAIVGENATPYAAFQAAPGNYIRTGVLNPGDPGDVAGLTDFTIEAWLKVSDPSISRSLIVGPLANSQFTYALNLLAGTLQFNTYNAAGTVQSLTGGTIAASTFYHVVGTILGGTKTLYVNGVSVASVGGITAFHPTMDATAFLQVGDNGSVLGSVFTFDSMAFYRNGLSAATAARHYQAGTQRGFPYLQSPDARINAVLDAVTNHAPRSIRTGTVTMTGSVMTGRPPLDELRKAVHAESVDAMLYISRGGAVVFLDRAHRSSSPWNTVQATLDDDGTDLPYLHATVDYSEAFLQNEWNVTATGGATQTSSDATSITAYKKRSRSLTDVPVSSDVQAATIATAMLAKYKDPFTRITSITLTTDVPDVAEAMFRRDLGDRIRVFRTVPGGGARIDQTLFIQKVELAGANDGKPWTAKWAVSPL